MQGVWATSGNSSNAMSQSGLPKLRESWGLDLVRRLREMGLATTARRYEAGQDVFLMGEPADGLYVLTQGLVKLSRKYPGAKEVTLHLIGPWESFGDLAPGASLTQGVRAHAFTDCEVLKTPKIFVERLVRTDREAAAGLLALMGLRLAHEREILGCLLPTTTEARIAVLLPILARRFGRTIPGGGIVLPPLTHYDLAEMVAATRESVTAAMRSLREQGLLKKEGRVITVLRPDALSGVASRRTHPTNQFTGSSP